MNEEIRVMRKSEIRRKKVKLFCAVGLKLRALPQKLQHVLKDRSTCVQNIHKGHDTNIPQSIR